LILLALLVGAESLWTHHSPSASFDVTKKLTLSGTLTQVEWVNPHIVVFMEAKRNDGSVEMWKFESNPPSWFRRVSVSRANFAKAIGQPVTIEGVRARDGSAYGVDVTSLDTYTWFGEEGYFHSAAMHVIERLWRVGENLVWQATVDDPKVLTTPWTMAPRVIKPSTDPLQESPRCIEDDGKRLPNLDHHLQR
jgi:hypothetical protein